MRNKQIQPHSISANQTFFRNKTSKFKSKSINTQHSSAFARPNSSVIKPVPRKNSHPITKLAAKNYSKDAEEVYEENIQLKKIINNLKKQVSLEHGQVEMLKKKNLIYSIRFSREFQKEIYYNDKNTSSYIVDGVKHQYQNLKKLYEQKNLANQELIRLVQLTNIQQMHVYIELLQSQNLHLKTQLVRLLQPKCDKPQVNLQKYNKPYFLAAGDQNICGNKVALQKNYKQSLNIRLQRYRQKCQLLINKLQQSHNKIQFLQKIIILRDNSSHQSRRKLRKNQKKISLHELEIQRLKQVIQHNKQSYTKQSQIRTQNQAKKYKQQQSEFKTQLLQNDNTIGKLKKENQYLRALINSYGSVNIAISKGNLKNKQIIPPQKIRTKQDSKFKQLIKQDFKFLDYCMPINKDDVEEDMIRRRIVSCQNQNKDPYSLLTYELFNQNKY